METILIDFDGVLTDGKHYIDSDGKKFYAVHSRDNSAIAELINLNYKVIIVTANDDPIIKEYANRRKCEYLYSRDKDIEATYAIGDSTFDIPMLVKAKRKFCPRDASETVKRVYGIEILNVNAGHGVIEHFIAKL